MTAFSARGGRAPALARIPRTIGLALALPFALIFAGVSPLAAQNRPVTLAPQPLSGPAPAPEAKPAEATVAPGIKVDTLGDIDPNSVGLLDAGAGGLGIAMWRGTPRSVVEALLPNLPGAPQSAAGRDLYRRLLLSAAETPSGSAGKDVPSLVAIRVGRLLAQGDVVSAQGLLRVLPQRINEPAIARARAEVALLMNDNAGACSQVREQLDKLSATFWRKTQVFCQLLDGDKAGATIGAGLLQEQGVEDAPFFALARMLAGEKGVAVNGLEKPEPLHIAMMRAARVQVPPAVVTDGAPAVLRAVALSPNADLDTRLEAAEQAEMRGALDAENLRQLYLSVNFTPEELSGALSAAEKLSGPRGRALLYRAARSQNVASAQAEIISRAFALARKQGRLGTAVRVMLPILAGIESGDDLAWFAAEAGSAIYFAGSSEAAAKWMALARAKPSTPNDKSLPAMPSGAALWPLAQLASLPRPAARAEAEPATVVVAGAGVVTATPLPAADAGAAAFDQAAFDRWWKAAAVLGNEARASRASRLLSLVEALGVTVGDTAWSRLVTAPPSGAVVLPSPGLMAGLRHASAEGRVGETVLLALTALGAERPSKIDIRVLAPVVRALNGVGLTDPARKLAVEALFDVSA